MKENWRWIKGYEGIYQMSNFGRVKSFRREQFPYGYILSHKNSKGDYFVINLYNHNKERKTKRIHILVVETFTGDVPTGYEVHHKDGNKQNNIITNLEIIKKDEHRRLTLIEHPECTKGMVNYNKYIKPKPILQITKDGKVIGRFNNSIEASLATGICARNIHQVASKTPFNKKGGIRKQAGGYIWMYESEVMRCED